MKTNLLKIIAIIIVAMFVSFAAVAEEDSSPVELGLEIGSTVSFDTVGTEMQVSYGEADIYMLEEVTGSISIPLGIYTLGFYAYDGLELFYDIDTSADTVSVTPANTFSLGWSNDISIENVMDINVTLDFGVYVDSLIASGGVELDLTPSITFGGEYDFGLSWGAEEYLFLYFYPQNTTPFGGGELEGEAFLSFDYFHFFTDMIAGSIDFTFYNDILFYTDGTATDYDIEFTLGLGFDIYNFTPSISFYAGLVGTSAAGEINTYIGLAGGLGYSKDWLSIGVAYLGQFDVQAASADWENWVETSIGISL